ncbi:hypothetical protein PQ465_04820 [Sphingobacterium oryzagri]|uniref:Transglutaminase-like superfamily protein n=1 Tax=Sphingobacterium oryzagri TaxID=3025669 RepID=A0ABY7WL54_9SPHI|nr:hypothetical protein [Sphingobacterium sp. KACC 22765]WDF69705.1 hypothetical protein PQ465_04820 [Sphingobacterium sp. KACC 22765]
MLENHYRSKEDSTKLRAVQFLKENIGDHYSTLITLERNGDEPIPVVGENAIHLSKEYIKSKIDEGWQVKKHSRADSLIISTRRIINEIDYAYEAWINSPWYEDTPESVFLEYLLPYKIANEFPDVWRSEMNVTLKSHIPKPNKLFSYSNEKKKFMWDYKKRYVRKQTEKYYKYDEEIMTLSDYPSFSEIKIFGSGICFAGSATVTLMMRSIGIPAAIDFIPYWGSINGSHAIDVHWDPIVKKLVKDKPFDIPVAKIFRKVYGRTRIREDIGSVLTNLDSFPISYLKDENVLDVTTDHVKTVDVIHAMPEKSSSKLAYICVYSYGQWKPIFFGKVDNGRVTFDDMGTNILYRIALIDKKNQLNFISRPFHLTEDGRKIFPTQRAGTMNLSVNRINHGEQATVKKGRKYALYYVSNTGTEIKIDTKTSQDTTELVFRDVPCADFYVLREMGARIDYSRYFKYEKKNQNWMVASQDLNYQAWIDIE